MLAIDVNNLAKTYTLYSKPSDRLRQIFRGNRTPLYKEHHALTGINFSVAKGESVGVIGRNGAGKSTLLQIIAGVLKPTSGNVAVNGRVSALLELGSAFNKQYTGIENVFHYGHVLGISKSEMEKKLQQILDFADIGDAVHDPVATYSSGMVVRLAFAVAIHVEPDILIVDEALAVGDMFFQQKCTNRIRQMLDEGLTLFFVSHSISAVKSLCQKALYLKNGKQLAFGDAESVCNVYQNLGSQQTVPISPVAAKRTGTRMELGVNAGTGAVQVSDLPARELPFVVDSHFSNRLSQRTQSGILEFMSVVVRDAGLNSVAQIRALDDIYIDASFLVHKDVPEGVAIGVLIRNEHGVDVCAINSNIYECRLPEMKSGQRYVWRVGFKNTFCNGKYSVSIGAKPNPEGDFFYDRCFNATVFEVLPPDGLRYLPGIVFVPASFQALREKQS